MADPLTGARLRLIGLPGAPRSPRTWQVRQSGQLRTESLEDAPTSANSTGVVRSGEDLALPLFMWAELFISANWKNAENGRIEQTGTSSRTTVQSVARLRHVPC